MDLTGKIALITGAAGGVGAAVSRRFAADGATVVGTDVNDDTGRACFAELGGPHRYVHLDVSTLESWRHVTREIDAQLGALHIVHLNAGVMTRPLGSPALDDPLSWLTPNAFRRIVSVNVEGVVNGIMATWPVLEAGGGGDIVVTASTAGVSALEVDPLYSMTKHALVGLVRSLAPTLLTRGIRLNAVCPGGIDTPMVPPDLKAMASEMPDLFQAPSYIADVVVNILERNDAGGIWIATDAGPTGTYRYDPPLEPAGEPNVAVRGGK